ncbi:unnamed protein product, partial [Dibothriocephalus latus]
MGDHQRSSSVPQLDRYFLHSEENEAVLDDYRKRIATLEEQSRQSTITTKMSPPPSKPTIVGEYPRPMHQHFALQQSEIISFESDIASKLGDDEGQLSYLIHYCRDEAKDAIECCAILDPSE